MKEKKNKKIYQEIHDIETLSKNNNIFNRKWIVNKADIEQGNHTEVKLIVIFVLIIELQKRVFKWWIVKK